MPNELLEGKMDTNQNGIQEQELLNFVKDAKNLQELGNHLKISNRPDTLLVLSQQTIQKYLPTIDKKIKSNTPLTENEKNIMKIQYVLEKKTIPTNESELNMYLGARFNNIGYSVKAAPQKINIYPKGVGESIEARELTLFERKLQVQTILQAGQYYIQFLKDKGITQSQYEGDTPNQIIYFNELQTKFEKGEKLSDESVLFYIHQIFYDFSMSGGGYSEKAGAAYKGIDKILTSKEGRTKKNIENKLIEVLYQVRQIDATKGMKYKSADMLLNTLMQDVSSYKLERGPESYKLSASLMGMSLLKPLENGEFIDPLVAKMYTKLKNPAKDIVVSSTSISDKEGNVSKIETFGDSDIFTVFKKYKLPHEGASLKEMYDLQVQLNKETQKQELAQKASIENSIINKQNEEIENQTKEKEKLKKEFQKRGTDMTTPIAKQALAYFDQQILMNRKLVKGEPIEMDTQNGQKKTLTLDQIVQEQYKTIENKLMGDIVQKGIIYEVLQANKTTTNFIRDMKKSGTALTSDEKAVDMLADITGAGVYWSDETFNTAVEVSKELAIQIALMAISGGIANIAAKGTLLAIQGGAEFLGAGVYAARVARYANLGKTAFWSSVKFAPELFAADIIAEGAVFHLANTTLNAPLQGLTGEEYLNKINPFGTHEEVQADGSTKTISSMMGYAESVAFMGVMKSFGSLTNKITKSLGGETLNVAQQGSQIIKSLEWKTLNFAQKSQIIKNVLTANLITLPGEIVSMQGTSAIVGLTFGNGVDLTPQSWAQTLAMVVGLRISHMGTGSLGKISQNIEGKIQEKSMKQGTLNIGKVSYDKAGNVQVVDYSVLDATGKVLDQGTASQKTIESAMKEKKGKEEATTKSENGSVELATTSLEIQKNSEKISEVLASGDAQKFSIVMKDIRSNRQNRGWKDALSTLKQTTSVYKTELLDGVELLKANIHTNPELAFKGLQKISTNGLKLGILLFNCLPISPIPGNKVLLLGLIATEFKSKGPMYEAIMELHAALKEKVNFQVQGKESNLDLSLNMKIEESKVKPNKALSHEILKDNNILSNIGKEPIRQEYIQNSLDNLNITSRTAQGIIDVSASKNKVNNVNELSSNEAQNTATNNFRGTMEYLYDARKLEFNSPKEVQDFLVDVAKKINGGILKDNILLRNDNSDKYPNYTLYENIPQALSEFSTRLYDYLQKIKESKVDPIEVAAWVEYRINFKDHFFADGCGKTSAALANYVLMKAGLELPTIRSRDEWFQNAGGKERRNINSPYIEPGFEEWLNYYKTLFTGNEQVKYLSKKLTNKEEAKSFIEKINGGNHKNLKPDLIGRIGETNDYIVINKENKLQISELESFDFSLSELSKENDRQLFGWAERNQNKIYELYEIAHGKVIDVDEFRTFLGGDLGLDANITQRTASDLADKMEINLPTNKNEGKSQMHIRMLGGGAGSGKGTLAVDNHLKDAVVDGTLKTTSKAIDNIKAKLEKGYFVEVMYVFRPMQEAWNDGVIKRVLEQNSKGLRGRTVPLSVFEKGHVGSRETIVKLHETFKDNPHVTFIFGTTGNGGTKRVSIQDLSKLIEGDSFDKESAKDYTEKVYNNGGRIASRFKNTLGIKSVEKKVPITEEQYNELNQ